MALFFFLTVVGKLKKLSIARFSVVVSRMRLRQYKELKLLVDT